MIMKIPPLEVKNNQITHKPEQCAYIFLNVCPVWTSPQRQDVLNQIMKYCDFFFCHTYSVHAGGDCILLFSNTGSALTVESCAASRELS